MNRLVLLPSAKLIPLELQNEFGKIPSAMIPLDSRPAVHYIYEYYKKEGFDFLVAVHDMADEVIKYCNEHENIMASIVDVGDTRNLGTTTLIALESLKQLPDYLIINFADTFTGDKLIDGDFIFHHKQEDVYRWTTFQINDCGKIINIRDKGIDKNNTTESQFVFVGIFGVSDPQKFVDFIRSALLSANGAQSELDPFYVGLCDYYNSLHKSKITFYPVKHWWDFGHLDTYYETKRKISNNFRYFNNMKVDNGRGIIQKSSKNSKKLKEEIEWYLKLPSGLQYMAPRIFNYNLSFEEPSVKMEFYGYPALNDMYLYGNHNIGVWNHIFDAIENIISDMSEYVLEPIESVAILASMKSMYEVKTKLRLKKIISDKRFEQFFYNQITINGKRLLGLNQIMDLLPDVINKVNLYDLSRFSIIHGDLCLSNILYDQRNRIVRVVDPRGGFGSYDIYGDPRYDIAKLCHSIEGDYDFLVNSLFSLRQNQKGLNFKVHIQNKHKAIKTLFRKRLIEKWQVNYTQIKLIESLLFLSMVPLHADKYNSQIAFIARGLELFTAIVNNTLSITRQD